MDRAVRLTVALGSGGARGFAHIGVLQALEEAGIRVSGVAGSSMGALIGAVYATGAPVVMLERIATHLPLGHWIDFTVPRMGLIAGERLQELLKLLTKAQTFEQTKIPLAVVATDLELGERVVFRSGPIHEAVRASIAIPGIFTPHSYQGRLLVDGGVIDRVPIDAARLLDADFVLAVDVGLFERLPPVRNVLDVVIQSMDIMEREIFRHRILQADYVVRPQLELMSATSFSNIGEAIEAGRQAMRASLGGLWEALDRKGLVRDDLARHAKQSEIG